jgi:glycerol-3-phosphate dehydrogenase
MFDFVVIGAGVVGGMVARELTKYTKSVCILEKGSDVALGATRANSAIVHAGFDAKEGSLKARLNVRGSKMMAEVCRDLGVKYKNNGSLVVGFNEEDEKTLLDLCERGKKNGVDGVRVIYRDEIVSLEPNIGEAVTVALHAPTGAIVCPYELCMAAVGNAMDNGAELKLNFKVDRIEACDDGYEIFSGDSSVLAKCVINCAGVYSDEVANMVGDNSFSVRPRRGEYMLLDREVGAHISHTIFRCPSKMGKGILVSPTVDGNLLVGPTAEDIDDKEDTRTTAAGLAKVRALASEQVKSIDFS